MKKKKGKKITILGKEIEVEMNMAVLIAYEGITGSSFLGEQFDTVKSRYALVCAVLAESLEDSEETADSLLRDADFKEFDRIFTEILALATEFFHVPDLIKGEEKSEDGQGN